REAEQSYLDDPQALDGRSLHDAVRELHSVTWSAESERTLRELLRRFIHICNAVAYAHSRGLIHRDLKPQNVMLGGFGETLVVDWGLAKVVGRHELHASGSEGTIASMRSADETAMGSIKGTLAYMPPEQARGEITSLGPHSDIYSLGAILYALLTGHPPITARNPREILDQVKAGRFPKPTECNQHVPKALEAVCLKALAKEPLDRYGTALELAADVARWLDDEPVSAWPEPFTIRAKRWVKSHQTAVTSTAAAILMATVTLTVMFVVVTGQKAEIAKSLQRETEAGQRERDAKLLAQDNERRAIAGEEEAKMQRDAATTARQIIDRRTMVDLIQMADTTLLIKPDSPFELDNDVMVPDGMLDTPTNTAERYYRSARDIAQQFTAANPQDSEAQGVLVNSLEGLGNVFLKRDRTDNALAQFQDALKIRRVLAEANPKDAQQQRDLSISFQRIGELYLKLGRTDEGLAQFQSALKINRVLAEADPNDRQRHILSISLEKLGDVFLALGRTDDALAQFQPALEIRRRELVEAEVIVGQFEHELPTFFTKFGDVLLKLGRTSDALPLFQDALTSCRYLAEHEPNDTQRQHDLSDAFERLWDVFLKLGRTDEALAHFQGEVTISRKWAEAEPYNTSMQYSLAISLEQLGDVFLKLGRTDDALAPFQDLVTIRRTVAEADPIDRQKQHNLAIPLEQLGDVFVKLGRNDDALAQFQAALKIRRRVLDEAELIEWKWEQGLANVLEKLGDVFERLGRTDDAVAQFQDVLKIRRRLAEAVPNSAVNQGNLAMAHIRLGDVYAQTGQFDQAVTQYTQCIAVLDAIIANSHNGQNLKQAQQQKMIVELARQICESAPIAIGDWDTLLKADAKILPELLFLRVTELAKRGQLREVAQAGAKLRDLATSADPGPANEQKGGMLYNAACAYGLCATLSLKDKPQPTDSEQAEQQKYLDLSLACLKEAVAAGYDNFDHMQQDSDLTQLRKLPEFQALLKQRSAKRPAPATKPNS
ncbi:MAG: serine/threonine protein kinase, partial [Planctomycetaceae bacterium]|nr:serine/threonine protein kinase [Planctomycetaceae bacterium]